MKESCEIVDANMRSVYGGSENREGSHRMTLLDGNRQMITIPGLSWRD
jgi:hypothetical protein